MRSALARWLRVVLPAALVVTVVVVVAGGAPAAADPLTPREAALALARQTGVPVTIDALTSETTTEQANPEGSFTAEVHLAPVRVRNTAGGWQPVDLNLQQHLDGSVAPGMHPRGLVLSGPQLGGTHSLAQLSQDGQVMGLMWQGALPAPALDGTRATYSQVRPGVDLIIDVTRTGFELSFVVADRAAADTVGTLHMPIQAVGLTTRANPDGGLEFVDAAGRAWSRCRPRRCGIPRSPMPAGIRCTTRRWT
jgi:hypothetical protein